MGLQNVLEQSDALRGVSDLNGAVPVENLNSLWNLTPSDPFTDLQTFDTTNAWDEANGGTVSLVSGLNRLETDGTQANSRVVLESAPLGIYRSGTQVRTAGGFTTANEPVEDQFYEWGYGRAAGESFVRFRDTADDIQVRASNEISGEKVVSRSAGHFDGGNVTALDAEGNEVARGDPSEVLRVYGLDPIDGTGPSGIDYDPGHGFVSGFRIGWYGPTVTVPFLVGVGDIAGEYREKVFPLCILEPIGEPLITRPNEPWTFVADNGGSAPGAGSGLLMDTGGRQFSYGGNIQAVRDGITHQTPPTELPLDGTGSTVELKAPGSGLTRDYYVLGVFKRAPENEETSVSLGTISATSNNDLYVHSRVIPESDLSGSLEYSEPTDTHAEESYVLVDAWGDTPDRVTIDTATIDGRTRLKGKSFGGKIVSGSGSKNDFLLGAEKNITLPFVRGNPTVLVGTTIDGNTGTTNLNIEFGGVR
jgi:hypothetical protein